MKRGKESGIWNLLPPGAELNAILKALELRIIREKLYAALCPEKNLKDS